MLTFHNDSKVKEKYVIRLKAHADADEIVQGKTWENGKGCAVGCTLENYNHKAYEIELGIPEWLARLEDTIFEGLNNGKAKKFAVDFLLAIPIGVDLTPVKWKFCAFILKENIERVLLLKIDDKLKEQVVSSIQGVLKLHRIAVDTGKWDESAAESARSAAWSAAESARSAESAAAESAAWSAAWSAESAAAESAAWSAAWAAWSAAESAWSAAESAESAAAWSAWSAAESAAWSARSAAESAAYDIYAKELLELLKKSK